MATMGTYCKAYTLSKLRGFGGWRENPANLREDRGGQGADNAAALADEDFLYVQDNYVVTDGIFRDANVVFDDVTPEWIEYCRGTLGFVVPESAGAGAQAAGAQ